MELGPGSVPTGGTRGPEGQGGLPSRPGIPKFMTQSGSPASRKEAPLLLLCTPLAPPPPAPDSVLMIRPILNPGVQFLRQEGRHVLCLLDSDSCWTCLPSGRFCFTFLLLSLRWSQVILGLVVFRCPSQFYYLSSRCFVRS